MDMTNLRLPGLERFRREFWSIAVVPQTLDSIIAGGIKARPMWLTPSAGSFIADPFGMVLPDGRRMLFAERLAYKGAGAANGIGEIVAAELAPGKVPADVEFSPTVALPHHASYPQILRDGSRWLMFVESWEANGLVCSSADRPEGPWRYLVTLLDGIPVVDPTMIRHGDLWYMFLTRQDDDPLAKLHLFTAPHPLGTWRPHPKSPVKIDRASARPGGPIFRGEDGHLYRPAQECCRTYGGALVIHRIDLLTPEEFHETAVRRIEPLPGLWSEGLHTICAFGRDTLIDGKSWRWSVSEPLENGRRHRRAIERWRAAAKKEVPDG